jgi:hypothetical protein
MNPNFEETGSIVEPLPNIIFLDMDGVLCNPRACLAVGNTGGVFSYLDPIACLLIKRLCDEHNAKLVISSSWRIMHDRYSIQAILNASCPNLGNKMYLDDRWCTSSFNGCTADKFGRGREIEAWIKANSTAFNRFAIVDDDSDMEPYMDSLVKTDTYNGIGFQDYLKISTLLKEPS